MKKIIIITVTFFCIQKIIAQKVNVIIETKTVQDYSPLKNYTLKVKVIDENNAPIMAGVILLSNHKKGVLTDTQGKASIDLHSINDTTLIKFSHLLYNPLIIKILKSDINKEFSYNFLKKINEDVEVFQYLGPHAKKNLTRKKTKRK